MRFLFIKKNYSSSRSLNEKGGDVGGSERRQDETDIGKKPLPTVQSSVISKNIKTRADLIKLQTKFNGSEQRYFYNYLFF